jgi:hypothetical protein
MDEEGLRKFLKRGGRSPSAIKRVLNHIEAFKEFLQKSQGKNEIGEVEPGDLKEYIERAERETGKTANTTLWALGYYFAYAENTEMRVLAGKIRESRIKRTPFPLRKFLGVNLGHIEALATVGIKNVHDMLVAGGTPERRRLLAEESKVPLDAVLELVKLSDLSRIPGIKTIRARLYHDAGVDTIEKIAGWDPEELRAMLAEWVERTGFEGIAPLPKEAEFSVEKARNLPKIVEYSLTL